MTAHIDVEELQTTKSEKLLAVVMAAFLLLAGVWAYQELDDRIREALPFRSATAADQDAMDRRSAAEEHAFRAREAAARTRRELELRREAYRTALEEGSTARALRRRYREAVATHERAVRERGAAGRAVAAAAPEAVAATRGILRDNEERRRLQERVIFLLRLGAAVVFIVVAFFVLARLRHRGSRYLPLAGAGVAFATVFAFVLAGDYLTDYFDPFDLGILLLALLGIAVTFVAFWVLQRYIARRLPRRRVRHGECPFCGYPGAGGERCEGCGRTVIAPCAGCDRPRRVGTAFCARCGEAA